MDNGVYPSPSLLRPPPNQAESEGSNPQVHCIKIGSHGGGREKGCLVRKGRGRRRREIARDFFKTDQAGLCKLSYCVDLGGHLLYITFKADNIIAQPDK